MTDSIIHVIGLLVPKSTLPKWEKGKIPIFNIIKGTNKTIKVILYHEDHSPVNLTGATLTLSVGHTTNVSPITLVMDKTMIIVSALNGIAKYEFVPADSISLQQGAYYGDITIDYGDGTIHKNDPPFTFVVYNSVCED